MKYYNIAAFILILNISMAVLNGIGVISTQIQPGSSWFIQINDDQLSEASYVGASVDTQNSFGFGDFIKGIFYFVQAVGLGIIYVPYTLSAFGIIQPFVYYMSLPVYFSYFIALAQFIGNRSLRSMK